MSVELTDLERWDGAILELVDAYGLDCFPQEFEICDHHDMLGYMAYSGMPSRYPHWSFGKSYEKLKTLYDYGASGLPYEMVINSNPSLAYLMGDNSLCLNVLTVAHVYGHNDFFKNNILFGTTHPEYRIASFKSHAERIRSYVEDPSIGMEQVEPFLDAAHSLSLQCRRNLLIRKLAANEQADHVYDASLPRRDPYQKLHKTEEYVAPDLRKIPLQPEEDILLFIRDYNPFLADWEKDVLTIVHEEAQYFLPQIETKIMNEGWASYWHYQIMSNAELPEALRLEFIVHHNQVIRSHPGGLNPYHVGFRLWESIYKRHQGDERPDHRHDTAGRRALFEARTSERDRSFLRRFLVEELARELGLFEYAHKRNDLVVTEVADEAGWEEIKATLVNNVGMGSVPVLRVTDADYAGNRSLLVEHCFDGRELALRDAEQSLAHLFRLWGREVVLKTTTSDRPTLLVYNEEGFATKTES